MTEATAGALMIAGTAGADPSGLAAAIGRAGWSTPVSVATEPGEVMVAEGRPQVAVLALDPTLPAGEEEQLLLAELMTAQVPTALVACRIDAYPAWPKTIAASRRLLDPDRALPVFAVSAALAAVPGEASGLAELIGWCHSALAAASTGADTAAPASATVFAAAVVPPVARPRAAAGAAEPVAAVRADRLTGLRAGMVAARTGTLVALRDSTADLGTEIGEANPGCGFERWLPSVLDALDGRVMALLSEHMEQVRAVALRGLPGAPGAPRSAGHTPVSAEAAPPLPRPTWRSEDLLVVLVGASMGFGVGRMAIGPALQWAGLGAAGTVLAILAGLLLAGWVVAVRRAGAVRSQLHRWAHHTIAARRAALEGRIAAEVGAAEAQCSREIWVRSRTAGN